MSGLALPATEKNAALPGTLANLISALNGKISDNPVILLSSRTEQIVTQVGKTYSVCSLNLPAGKWLLFGQTLASGDQYINGVTWGHMSRMYRGAGDAEVANKCFAISTGGCTATLIVHAVGTSTIIHADGAYVFLIAVKFL